MDWYVEEKRRHPRGEGDVCAWLSFPDDTAIYASLTMDLGLNGARFSTHRQVRKGDAVRLHLELPVGVVQCAGTVCWCRVKSDGQHTFGVQFTELREADRSNLRLHLGSEALMPWLAAV